MITRSIIKSWLMRDLQIDEVTAIQILKRMSDEDIACEYGLTIIRKGWFV